MANENANRLARFAALSTIARARGPVHDFVVYPVSNTSIYRQTERERERERERETYNKHFINHSSLVRHKFESFAIQEDNRRTAAVFMLSKCNILSC